MLFQIHVLNNMSDSPWCPYYHQNYSWVLLATMKKIVRIEHFLKDDDIFHTIDQIKGLNVQMEDHLKLHLDPVKHDWILEIYSLTLITHTLECRYRFTLSTLYLKFYGRNIYRFSI